MGRDVEFLKAGQEKTPDLRVHDYPIPLVVECKRRHSVNEADIAEDAAMCALYVELRTACRGLGVTGVIELHLTTPPEALPLKDIVAACVRHRLAADPTRVTAHNWGTVRYLRSPSRLRFPPTRLYSPNFLRAVFNWDTDLPSHDGIVCQVKHPRGFIVDEAREPLALVWTNEHPKVLSRRTRAMMALFAKAMRQIPPGEVGLVYACYQEGDREVVADTRTRQLIERLREWTHEWQISMPATIISRLVARPLHDGAPDLIETGLQFYSATDGSPDWFAEFPTKVFTP